jgi:cyclopropane fatty-acyl-phospholipid synthase-like methyltransferase
MTFKKIESCRISGSSSLVHVLDLGEQSLTGVFPRVGDASPTIGPLRLAWCPVSGLLQLEHNFDLNEMYGENYGYRSGLNIAMVDHLAAKVKGLVGKVELLPDDYVLDIGSNDGTLLHCYKGMNVRCVGIDPTAAKFKSYYDSSIRVVPEFFNAQLWRDLTNGVPAKIISSIAMFYDLESPSKFVKDVYSCLSDEGIWHFEQSYMPSMLRTNSYDTVCHEHLEYYSLSVVDKLLSSEGFKILDVKFNGVNGGSFAVTAAKSHSKFRQNDRLIQWLLGQEDRMNLNSPRPYREFEHRVFAHRDDLQRLIRTLVADGKKVAGYGASTKGNVLLQFCGFTQDEIFAIAEVNRDKFGRVTPGTNIPIISEESVKRMQPDYMLVLPWHFRDGIVRREKEFLASGGSLIFPFPEIEIV